MRKEWKVDHDPDGELTLALNATDEGIVLDVFNEAGDSILTEAMMADEWVEWMIARELTR